MTKQPNALPLRSLYDRPNVARSYVRSIAAKALARSSGDSAEDVVTAAWPRDVLAAEIARAAVSPASMSSAAQIAPDAVGAFLSGLAPRSAAARLFDAALQVQLAGRNSVLLPRLGNVTQPGFVAEGAPAPVTSGTFENAALGPERKILILAAITNELASASQAEAVVRTALGEAAAVSLDSAVFDATAASATRPAGLLNGVTGLTPTGGGGETAMVGDLQKLVGAIATAGGGADTWLFASPPQAMVLAFTAGPAFNVPVIPVPALAAGTIIALDPAAIASGFSGLPEFEVSRDATVHFEDTNPAPIGTAGTPNVVAAPVRSAFQQNLLLLKLRLQCAWAVRAPGFVQFITGTTW